MGPQGTHGTLGPWGPRGPGARTAAGGGRNTIVETFVENGVAKNILNAEAHICFIIWQLYCGAGRASTFRFNQCFDLFGYICEDKTLVQLFVVYYFNHVYLICTVCCNEVLSTTSSQ